MGFRKDRRDEDDNDGLTSKSQKADKNSGEQVAALAAQALIDIARLQTEYTKYFAGAEKKPPRPLRESLDQLIEKIKNIRKSTNLSQAANLKVQNALNSYQTYKALWDKQLLALEKGKPQRS